MIRRTALATAAAALLAACGIAGYAVGHDAGTAAGRRAGAEQALTGVNPADLALIRQLAADRAQSAAPAGGLNCERTGLMAKSPSCADVVGAARATTLAGGTFGNGAAVAAGELYLEWLQAHPTTTQPLAMSRLRNAEVALPAGSLLQDLADTTNDGSDDDGLVQVDVAGELACIDVIHAGVTAGGCYGFGPGHSDMGGYYTPKRFTPAYEAEL